MSQSAVRSAVRGRLTSLWDTSVAGVREPNANFDPQGRPWVEIRFPGAMNERADLGAPDAAMWEEAGAFMCDVYVPDGAGEEAAASIADALAEIYQGQDFDFVTCFGRMSGQYGRREPDGIQGVWWGISFGIAYRYQSIATP